MLIFRNKISLLAKRLRCYFGGWMDNGAIVPGFEFLPNKKVEVCLGPNDVCLTQQIVGKYTSQRTGMKK